MGGGSGGKKGAEWLLPRVGQQRHQLGLAHDVHVRVLLGLLRDREHVVRHAHVLLLAVLQLQQHGLALPHLAEADHLVREDLGLLLEATELELALGGGNSHGALVHDVKFMPHTHVCTGAPRSLLTVGPSPPAPARPAVRPALLSRLQSVGGGVLGPGASDCEGVHHEPLVLGTGEG